MSAHCVSRFARPARVVANRWVEWTNVFPPAAAAPPVAGKQASGRRFLYAEGENNGRGQLMTISKLPGELCREAALVATGDFAQTDHSPLDR